MLTTLLGGRFVRLDYDWSYRGTRQEGSLLIGCQSDLDRMTVHWIDSWHMSDAVLACTGAVEESGDVDVRGSYAAPPGPDWGWRIVIRPADPAGLHVVMHNVTPRRRGGRGRGGDLRARGRRRRSGSRLMPMSPSALRRATAHPNPPQPRPIAGRADGHPSKPGEKCR